MGIGARRHRVVRWIAATVVLYVAWLGMLVVHEFGHALAAVASGGRVASVRVPLIGFSQTIAHPNPRELLVVWAGPIVGALLPVIGLLIWRRPEGAMTQFWRFFAGFCLIANGAYIGIGWTRHAGDAGDMIRLGTSVWVMIAFGLTCTVAGFFVWHHTQALTIAYWREIGR